MQHDQRAFTEAELTLDHNDVGTIVSIAFRVARATGFYRTLGDQTLFLHFGAVTIAPTNGESEREFVLNIDA